MDHSWAEIVSAGLCGFDERFTKLFVQEQHERERLAEESAAVPQRNSLKIN